MIRLFTLERPSQKSKTFYTSFQKGDVVKKAIISLLVAYGFILFSFSPILAANRTVKLPIPGCT